MLGAINWHSFFFLLFAGVTCGFSVAVLVSSNIVRMAFYLIVSLSATAGLFILAGATFVGAMQIMIYVGGTLGAADLWCDAHRSGGLCLDEDPQQRLGAGDDRRCGLVFAVGAGCRFRRGLASAA